MLLYPWAEESPMKYKIYPNRTNVLAMNSVSTFGTLTIAERVRIVSSRTVSCQRRRDGSIMSIWSAFWMFWWRQAITSDGIERTSIQPGRIFTGRKSQ